jgi:hypothetical protein
MSVATRALICGLSVLLLAGCASLTKPPAVTRSASGALVSHGRVDDPRTKHAVCLRQHQLPVSEPTPIEIQVGQPGIGPLIRFLPTPGAAQEAQIAGQAQSAEAIGSALLYPNQAPDSELQVVENCAALGVQG